jgi:hypothetical protein
VLPSGSSRFDKAVRGLDPEQESQIALHQTRPDQVHHGTYRHSLLASPCIIHSPALVAPNPNDKKRIFLKSRDPKSINQSAQPSFGPSWSNRSRPRAPTHTHHALILREPAPTLPTQPLTAHRTCVNSNARPPLTAFSNTAPLLSLAPAQLASNLLLLTCYALASLFARLIRHQAAQFIHRHWWFSFFRGPPIIAGAPSRLLLRGPRRDQQTPNRPFRSAALTEFAPGTAPVRYAYALAPIRTCHHLTSRRIALWCAYGR